VPLLAQANDQIFATQSTFRAVMSAMARPGTVQSLRYAGAAPEPMARGTAAIASALFDQDTAVWLHGAMAGTPDAADWLRFHTGCPIVGEPSRCDFALIADAASLPAFDRFMRGTSDYPDRSTTVILQVGSVTEGRMVELRGPGIDGATRLHVPYQPADLLDRLAANAALFPHGIDLVLVAGDSVVALPRTARATAKES
jgi:alpha-D-ribose 1-methylphosphonate 5-triphosphate synthase subunit PhnH